MKTVAVPDFSLELPRPEETTPAEAVAVVVGTTKLSQAGCEMAPQPLEVGPGGVDTWCRTMVSVPV